MTDNNPDQKPKTAGLMNAAKQLQEAPLECEPKKELQMGSVGLASQTSIELADKVENLEGPLSSQGNVIQEGEEPRSGRSFSKKNRTQKGSFKIEGSGQEEDVNRSVSPPAVEGSELAKIFKIEEWGNIPAVMVDTIEALVNASENQRKESAYLLKKMNNQGNSLVKKIELNQKMVETNRSNMNDQLNRMDGSITDKILKITNDFDGLSNTLRLDIQRMQNGLRECNQAQQTTQRKVLLSEKGIKEQSVMIQKSRDEAKNDVRNCLAMCDNINNMINEIEGVIEPNKKVDSDSDSDGYKPPTYHDLKEFIIGTHRFVTEEFSAKQTDYVSSTLKQFKMDLKLEDRFKQSSTQINMRSEMNKNLLEAHEQKFNQFKVDLKELSESKDKEFTELRIEREEAVKSEISQIQMQINKLGKDLKRGMSDIQAAAKAKAAAEDHAKASRSSKKSSRIDASAFFELQSKVEGFRAEDKQKNKEYQLETNDRLENLNGLIKELSSGTTLAIKELKAKLDISEPEGHEEEDILARQMKMMNPIKRALLQKLESKPISNISEPQLLSEEHKEDSSDEEKPGTWAPTDDRDNNTTGDPREEFNASGEGSGPETANRQPTADNQEDSILQQDHSKNLVEIVADVKRNVDEREEPASPAGDKSQPSIKRVVLSNFNDMSPDGVESPKNNKPKPLVTKNSFESRRNTGPNKKTLGSGKHISSRNDSIDSSGINSTQRSGRTILDGDTIRLKRSLKDYCDKVIAQEIPKFLSKMDLGSIGQQLGGSTREGSDEYRQSNKGGIAGQNSVGERYYVKDHQNYYQQQPPFLKAEFISQSDEQLLAAGSPQFYAEDPMHRGNNFRLFQSKRKDQALRNSQDTSPNSLNSGDMLGKRLNVLKNQTTLPNFKTSLRDNLPDVGHGGGMFSPRGTHYGKGGNKYMMHEDSGSNPARQSNVGTDAFNPQLNNNSQGPLHPYLHYNQQSMSIKQSARKIGGHNSPRRYSPHNHNCVTEDTYQQLPSYVNEEYHEPEDLRKYEAGYTQCQWNERTTGKLPEIKKRVSNHHLTLDYSKTQRGFKDDVRVSSKFDEGLHRKSPVHQPPNSSQKVKTGLHTATTLAFDEPDMRKTLLNVTSSQGTVNNSRHNVTNSRSPPREDQVQDGHLVAVTFEKRAGIDSHNPKRSRSPTRNL